MTCAEAREAMSGLLAGRLGLTEWAELEAHTAACEVCDRALDLRYHDIFEERRERERPVASRAGRAARRAGIGVAAVLALGALGVYASPRLLPEISSTLRGLRLPELAGDFLDSLTASLSRVASTHAPSPARPAQDPRMVSAPPVPSAPAPPARPAQDPRIVLGPPVASTPASPAGPAEDSRTVSPPPVVSMPMPPPAQPTEDSPGASAPPTASSPATALPTPAPTPPAAAPSPPAVAARPPTSSSSLPPRPTAPRRPARAYEQMPEQRATAQKPGQKATAQKPVKERSVAQSPRVQDERPRATTPRPLTDARADVIAQLSVQDRQEARRDIGLLLARLGGSRKAEKDSTVWLVVPRSRYSEFTRGLAQIGSSQMEQGSNALPDPVAVTVILTR